MIKRQVVCDVCGTEMKKLAGSLSVTIETKREPRKLRAHRRSRRRGPIAFAEVDVCKLCAVKPLKLAALQKSSIASESDG